MRDAKYYCKIYLFIYYRKITFMSRWLLFLLTFDPYVDLNLQSRGLYDFSTFACPPNKDTNIPNC